METTGHALRPPVLVATPYPEVAMARAQRLFDIGSRASRMMRSADVVEAARRREAQAILISVGLVLGEAEIEQLPGSVRIISTASVGFDHIDLAAAARRGVLVSNTPDVLTDATADLAMLLILGACRRVKENMQIMAEGWVRSNGFSEGLGLEVTGRTLGIVGMGRIGRALARRARGFGMPILYHNRTRLPEDLEEGATYFANLEDMLPECAILSLNLPGGRAPVMTRDAFARLPDQAVLVNAARGSLVDEEALLDALASGRLAAAGLDVYRREPGFDRRLAEHPRTFLLPHVGSATTETRLAMAMRAIDNVEAALAGRPVPDEVRV
jgi:lactate dehydrogenase-like 2-hydroxyacid dehydrogenase